MAGVPSFSTEEEEALSASLIAQLLQEDQTDPFAAARSLFVSDEGSVEDDELYSLGGERKPKKRGKRKGTAKSRGKKQVKKQRTSPSVEGIDVNETSTINVGKEEKKQDHLQKKSKRKSYPETRVTVPPDDLVKMSVEDIVAYADNIKATRLDLTEDEKKDLKRMERLVKNRESARAWRARKKEQKESNGSNAAEEIDVQQPSPKKPRQAKRSKKESEAGEDSKTAQTGTSKREERLLADLPKKVLPQRRRGRKDLAAFSTALSTDSNYLMPCLPFASPSDAPFRLSVSMQSVVTADSHAHASQQEIIGFLGGEWNEEEKMLRVVEAFPCRAVVQSSKSLADVEVEIEPAAEFEVRSRIAQKNLVPVGWYHSHPTFPPIPSGIDVQNQNSYQSLFDGRPFIGLIISPYDERLPDGRSTSCWFFVHNGDPREIEPQIDATVVLENFSMEIRSMLEMYDQIPVLSSAWRYVRPGENAIVPCIQTYEEKLKESIAGWFNGRESREKREEVIGAVLTLFQERQQAANAGQRKS